MLQIGTFKLVGPAATATLFVVAAGITALIFYIRPRPTPLWISAALWIAFIAYWSAKSRGASAARSSESTASRRVHERFLNGSLLLLSLPIPFLTGRFVSLTWTTIIVGLAIHVASFALAIVARRHLGKHWSGAVTIKEGHEIVRTGPYAYMRHPIYTAMLGMFVGSALVSGQLHALIAVGLIAYAYARKIGIEEAALRQEFGEAYTTYQRETKALIPWIY